MNNKSDLEKLAGFVEELGVNIDMDDVSKYYGIEKGVKPEWAYERTILYIYEKLRKKK